MLRTDCVCRSFPHVLSFFGGHEAEGRFPVYELGCGGLLPCYPATQESTPTTNDASARPKTSPCSHLEAAVLDMPELTREASSCDSYCSTGAGLACSVSFGDADGGLDGVDKGEGYADGLSFEVCDARGQRVAGLTLRAASK